MRVTKVWINAKRRIAKPGFNDFGEADAGVLIELDLSDLPELNTIMHEAWQFITKNVQAECFALVGSETQRESLPAMFLGLGDVSTTMLRPAENTASTNVAQRLANYLKSQATPEGVEVVGGVFFGDEEPNFEEMNLEGIA